MPSIRYGRHTPASSTIDESLVTRQRDSRGGGEEALLFFKLFVESRPGRFGPTGAVARWTIPRVVRSTYPTIPIGEGRWCCGGKTVELPSPGQ